MNVLDRAIVKAYERRRQSQAAPQLANATGARTEMTHAPHLTADVFTPTPLPEISSAHPLNGAATSQFNRLILTPEEFLADPHAPTLVELNIPVGAPPYPPYESVAVAPTEPTPAPLPIGSVHGIPATEPVTVAAAETIHQAAIPVKSNHSALDAVPETIRVQTAPNVPGRVTYTSSFTRTSEPTLAPSSASHTVPPPVRTPDASTPASPSPVAATPVTPKHQEQLPTYRTVDAKAFDANTAGSNQQTTPVPVAPTLPDRPATQIWKWPEICEHLDQFTGDGFRQLAKHLQYAADQGHKVLGFVSSTPGTGRTSVLMTLARILALEGKSEALLIDADRRHPHLASLANTPPTVGLQDVLHGQIRRQQAVIPMTPGNLSLLPLAEPPTDAEWQKLVAPMRALLKQVRRDYDMILIDAGVLGIDTKLTDCWLRGAVDAVITISKQLTGKQTEHEVLDWKQIGIESLGVIETFS